MEDRWSQEKAWEWYNVHRWLVGCNFTPSTGINQLEMWQADTFDAVTIERELGWAGDLGFNTARVYLHDLVWENDPTGFFERINRFLEISSSKGIKLVNSDDNLIEGNKARANKDYDLSWDEICPLNIWSDNNYKTKNWP